MGRCSGSGANTQVIMIFLPRPIIAVLTVWVCTAFHAAQALPIDGEEKCSPAGTLMRYRDYSRGWVEMGGHCRYEPIRDMAVRNEYTGRPIDGEQRCNPDGDIVRYREYNQRWNRTGSTCEQFNR